MLDPRDGHAGARRILPHFPASVGTTHHTNTAIPDLMLPMAQTPPNGSTRTLRGTSSFIDEWLEERLGKAVKDVTIADIQGLPAPDRLEWESLTSELGGRLDGHLLHLTQDEADDLEQKGDRFLAETRSKPEEHA
jgi:hypothetical protein